MIFTKGGDRWRIVEGMFCGLYLARWIEDRKTGGHWLIVSQNFQPTTRLLT